LLEVKNDLINTRKESLSSDLKSDDDFDS